ncbi:MAG: hypothetical protein KUG72_07350 [Pseudomonadales bacterium]|nr:hypothetical protein [Pseudomonadales bacterium]
MDDQNHTPPVRLRPTTEHSIGTTAFFRNRPLYDVLLEELKAQGKNHYKLLFHACSIGAEVYSFIIQYALGGYIEDFIIEISATDLEQGFVEYARNGHYPADILIGMSESERSFFADDGANVSVVADLKQVANFLDASSFLDFKTDQVFDVVFLLNTLIYVPEDKQALAVDKIASYDKSILVTSAFHMSTIKDDLVRNHYQPVLTRQQEIHNSWTDRRMETGTGVLAPGIYTDWRLPAFSEIEGFEYKYCALFRKTHL